MHCQIAEGSESTGKIEAPVYLAFSTRNFPAITIDSLLANIITFPELTASNIGLNPIAPDLSLIHI